MSDTPFDAAALRRHLAGTKTGPSDLFDHLVRHHTNPAAVEVLYKHAEGSFPLLAAVFAAKEQLAGALCANMTALPKATWRFSQQADTWLHGQCQSAADTDLRSVLCTARTVFFDKEPLLFMSISYWFVMFDLLDAVTDKVVAEMSVWETSDLCPQLGTASPPKNCKDPLYLGVWLMSRYLYHRFGKHDPSWVMFRELYDPPETKIGDVADLVVKVNRLNS